MHRLPFIIIIGTTAPFERRPSSEASVSCLYSLQHSSNFSPPTSWHLPSHHLPILVLACPSVFFLNDSDLYRDKTFHEPILRSLNRFIGCHISDSPAIASLDFITIFFRSRLSVLRPTPSNPGGPIGLLLSRDLRHRPIWHGRPYQ